jgi:hypothetical protein
MAALFFRRPGIDRSRENGFATALRLIAKIKISTHSFFAP